MKKLFVLVLLTAVINTGCVKSLVSPTTGGIGLPVGTVFVLNGNITLNDLKKPDGQVPTEPFTITSICSGDASSPNSFRYWATSANGLTYNIPATDLKVVK